MGPTWLVFYIVLRSIPYLGWVIEVAVMALGLGAIWLSFRDRAPATAELALESE